MASCLLIPYKTKRMNLLVKQTLIGGMLEAAAADTTISGCIMLGQLGWGWTNVTALARLLIMFALLALFGRIAPLVLSLSLFGLKRGCI